MSSPKQSVTMPVRSYTDPVDTECPFKWRYGEKPDYTAANEAWAEGKLCNHVQDSLEMIVENLVKTWEFEASHKIDPSQWGTIDPARYRISGNENTQVDIHEMIRIGNYNLLLKNQPPAYYDSDRMTFEESHSLFRNAMKTFPWEVLKVHQGPPTVIFDWRHWGSVDGVYTTPEGETVPPSGQLIELFGYAIVEVDSHLKITNIRTYFDPKPFFEALQQGISTNDIKDKTILQFETSQHRSMIHQN